MTFPNSTPRSARCMLVTSPPTRRTSWAASSSVISRTFPIGQAGNPLLPHSCHQLRTVTLPVKDCGEALQPGIGCQCLRGWLSGNLLGQPGENLGFQNLDQPRIHILWYHEERLPWSYKRRNTSLYQPHPFVLFSPIFLP